MGRVKSRGSHFEGLNDSGFVFALAVILKRTSKDRGGENKTFPIANLCTDCSRQDSGTGVITRAGTSGTPGRTNLA
jgi:hypothetical protein